MSDEDTNKVEKFYLNRAGKKVEVNIDHITKPHAFQPKKLSQGEKSSPLIIGGDHRPTANPKGKPPGKTEK
ncbi:LAME_0H18404g1_1 [Lachancea meyersii CBS 8951]|uniref:LAME_0H18404g1_1 n=1 Tax=Lachancea meyersii CBS 8951 TaxID=1266667 RepID=A0A1G4KIW1_9SACH|nr:LAME_0H18404g1_1 [Lachancea meyersii CBS 8951]